MNRVAVQRTAINTRVHMSPYSREHHTAVVAPVSAVSPAIEEFGGSKKDDVSGAGPPPLHRKYSESGKPAAGYTNGLSLLRRLLRWWLARFGHKPLAKKGTLIKILSFISRANPSIIESVITAVETPKKEKKGLVTRAYIDREHNPRE